MAETALERYKKDQQQQEEKKTPPGQVRELNEVQNSFLKALENITEPTPPVKYLKPFNPFQKEDKSLARFILSGSPNMKLLLDQAMSKKYDKPVDSMQLLKDGEEKDYISILDEIRKGVDSGSYDLMSGLGTTLFTGLDYTFDSDFLGKFDKMMKDKEPDRPETWRGDLVGLMTQFAIPGGIIQKVLRRTKTAGQIKKIISGIKGGKKAKVSKIAARAIEGMAVVGATDFLASEQGRSTPYFEPESTKGLKGKERAAAEFRNRIKYGQEGAIIGAGFPLIGKGLQLGYKFGLAPFVKTTAKLGAKGINTAVFRPISYLGSREAVKPVVAGTAKTIRNATDFVLTKALAPAIVSTFSGKIVKQLPKFEDWRLYSVTNPAKEKRVIKRLDNILSYFRSFGKAPKDIEGISEKAMLFIKGRARKLDRTMEGIEKRSYELAKKFENNYNSATTSPALQKHYLDQIEEFLRGQLKREDLPKELVKLADDLKLEIKNTMKEFKKALPKGKDGDAITKNLEGIEINRIKDYMLRSFSTFTNPNYAPDEKVYNTAIDWVAKNVVGRNKDLKIRAKADFPKLDINQAYNESAQMMVEAVLRAGKAEGRSPLQSLKEIGKLIRFKDYKFLKTGEELPNAIKNLLGPEKKFKSISRWYNS